MRVLQLIPSLQVGGAERVVALLVEELQALGHEPSVVALGSPSGSWIEEDLRSRGVEPVFLGKAAGLDLRVVPRLAKALRSLRPDVVHTHLHVLKYLLPAQSAWRCPVVHTLHNLADREATKADQRLQQVAFRAHVEPVAIGDAVAASARVLYGVDVAAVIPNGIAIDGLRTDAGARAELREELGLGSDAVVFVVVGRLNPQKNHAGLLEALTRCPEGHLLVVGEGELRAELEARVEALGLSSRVQFLGVRGDVPRLYAASDLLVLSSHYEGNPLVVMEAMAAGLPVVATAVGCVPELVGPATGRLVVAGDPEALGRALAELASDGMLRQDLGVEGARVARVRFASSSMAREYARLYAKRVSRSEAE